MLNILPGPGARDTVGFVTRTEIEIETKSNVESKVWSVVATENLLGTVTAYF